MKCLRCNLVNPPSTNVCKRCQAPLFSDPPPFSRNKVNVYRDAGFLVVGDATALPKRCCRCNSRDIVVVKKQTLEYVPALDQLVEFAVGQIVPIPLNLSSSRELMQLDLFFCRRHRSARSAIYKLGWSLLLFGLLCFAFGFYAIDYSNVFAYAMITAVAAFCVGALFLYIDKEQDIVSKHKYRSPYFWVKGFGEEYLSSFPNWTP